MALLEDRSAAFIVRVWGERGDTDDAVREWRGSVEHVQSGERAFFRHLEQAVAFMHPHLEHIGIDVRQRFWEHIATVMDSDLEQPAPPLQPASPLQSSLPAPPPFPPHRPRKRR